MKIENHSKILQFKLTLPCFNLYQKLEDLNPVVLVFVHPNWPLKTHQIHPKHIFKDNAPSNHSLSSYLFCITIYRSWMHTNSYYNWLKMKNIKGEQQQVSIRCPFCLSKLKDEKWIINNHPNNSDSRLHFISSCLMSFTFTSLIIFW